MKKILFFLAIFFIAAVVFAQAPQKFSYQAVVRDAGNNLVTSHAVGVRISILQGGVAGSVVYMESQTATTNANGLMTLQIGGGTVLSGDIAAIDWADGPYFLKTETDPSGGTNYTIEGTQQLLSVPYALYAGSTANGFSGSYNDLTDQPTIPTVPTNVSAFTNDAGYITTANLPTNVSYFANDAQYITQVTLNNELQGYATSADIPTVPTNVSAFTNDAGYITSAPAQVNADWNATSGAAQILNKPTIPTVPTTVSSFQNDAQYITQTGLNSTLSSYATNASIPTNVSAFTNDAGYITSAPAQVNADWNATSGAAQILNKPELFSGDYNDLTNQPTIPTVPTNVSAFTNDAGYVTQSTLATENYITQNDLVTNNYVTTADIPTNVSAFENDANYITSADIPAQVNADWDATNGAAQILNKPELFSGDYNDLTNQPTLFDGDYNSLSNRPVLFDGNYNSLTNTPTIPTVPTNVSAFTNDANYITSYTEQQILSISNDTIYLTGGSFVKLPAGFSGNYNDLTDIPENVSTFNNDAGYLTRDSLTGSSVTPQDIQDLLDRIEALELQLSLPVLSTNSATNINSTSAVSGGAVVSSYTAVTERGICWNTAGTPTIADSHTSDGNGVGSFVSPITSLTPVTTYYVRAYATNSIGTGYGPQISFTTLDVPTMVTNAVDGVTSTTATVHCTVSSDHGANVTVQGVCWNTTGAPTTADSTRMAPLGSANYDVVFSSLSPATTYYVRAYAVNSEGTGYGNVLTFVTSNEVPYVTTAAVTVVNTTSATCGGNVTSANGSSITARGVCWSTSQSPTIADSHTTDGSGTGSFTSSITGLTAVTTYYVRAYATNSSGTGYGEQRSFTTPLCGTYTLTDIDGNTYNTVQIGNQCWMKENLKTTKYSDGTSIAQGGAYSSDAAYWYYPGNSSANKATYGLLYNWKAVMGNSPSSSSNPSGVQGICPTGWRVPSDAEWTQLTDYVSSQSQYCCSSITEYIAKALASTTGWSGSTTTCAIGNTPSSNNATGFSALPAGYCNGSSFGSVGSNAYFWSATSYSSDYAYYLCFCYDYARVGCQNCWDDGRKSYGYSVRCLRDN